MPSINKDNFRKIDAKIFANLAMVGQKRMIYEYPALTEGEYHAYISQ